MKLLTFKNRMFSKSLKVVFLISFVFVFIGFFARNSASAYSSSLAAPYFGVTATLSPDQKTLTYNTSSSNRAGESTQNCGPYSPFYTAPDGQDYGYIGGKSVMEPYLMGGGTASVLGTNISGTILSTDITQLTPGTAGTACNDPSRYVYGSKVDIGQAGTFTTAAKTLDVSSLPTGSYTLSVTICTSGTVATQTNACGTKTYPFTISSRLPTATLSVTPTTVTSGDRATLTWSSTNTTSCTAGGPWSNAGTLSGSGLTDPINSNTTYTFQCTGPGGTTPVQSVTVTVGASTGVNQLTISPASIVQGSSATVSWSAKGKGPNMSGPGFSVTNVPETVPFTGSRVVGSTLSPGTYTYSLSSLVGPSAMPYVATTNATLVVVPAAPTATLSVAPTTVTSGDRATLTWSSTNTTNCTAGGPWSNAGTLSGSGLTDPINSNTTYTFQCTGPGGTTPVQSVTVKAIVPFQTPPAPVVTISASPVSVPSGGISVITWSTVNATQGCTASGDWSGPQAETGTYVTGPLTTGSHTYTLTCYGGLRRPGSSSITVTATAGAIPTVSVVATPSSLTVGGSTSLSWTSTSATNCSAYGNWTGTKAVSGLQKISNITPSGSYLYGLTCTGPGGSGDGSTNVVVNPVPRCSNGATNYPSCDACASSQVWDTSSLACVLPLGITVSPTDYPLTLPSSIANVTYTFTNGTLSGTNCRLLDSFGVPLSSYTPCTGSISVAAPTTVGSYAYAVEASKSSTGEVAKSANFTITINPAPACSNGANNPPSCDACTLPQIWDSGTLSCILPVSANLTAATSSTNVASQSNSCTSTTISWNTSTPADSYVKYSTSPALTSPINIGNGTMVTSHSVALTGLAPATTYYYEVTSTDAYNQTAVDNNNGSYYNFTTSTCTGGTTTTSQTSATPVVTISASPTSVQGGGNSVISWSANNATQGCVASGDWTGSKPTSGTYTTGALSAGTHTFALVCTGNLGVVGSNSTTVTATPVTSNGSGASATASSTTGGTSPGANATSTISGTSGSAGGSGGGGGVDASGGTGTSGQGFSGGSGNTTTGGGGGGSSAPGSSTGAGGAGTSNTITGTSVTYATGGSGAAGYTGVGLSGGENTGNGGSAGSIGYPGGNGGSGVVIIAYQTGTITATGGIVTVVGSTTIHTFTSGGDFTVTSGSGTIEVLVIGGGGGGGGNGGGGGGAGGYLYETTYPVTPQTYPVTVGVGGLGGDGTGSAATNGGNSSFGPIVAIGGGAGGSNVTGVGVRGGAGIIAAIVNQVQNAVNFIVPQALRDATRNVAILASDVIVITKEGVVAFTATPVGSVTTKTVTAAGVVGGGAVAVTTATGTVTAFSDIALVLMRLWSLILVALGLRKRRVPWGTVYDSVTKQPLDPAYVVLEDQTGKEVATAITDLDGRFGFLVPPGSYKIIANKSNYSFPSKKLAGKSSDELYDNLYFDGEVALKVDDVITKNVPMDPEAFDWNEFAKRDKKLMKFYSRNARILATVTTTFFYLGLVGAAALYLSRPDGLNLAIIIVYGLLLLLRIFVIKPKSYGSIVDTGTNEPLSFAVVRVFQKGVDREMFHRVADQYGRYYALLAKGEYYVIIERKNLDGSYTPVYTSGTINAKKGIINNNFSI